MSMIEEQWEFLLKKDDEDARRVATRAYQEPALRKLFPYTSMSNLKFSKKVEHPYDALPYIYVIKDEPRRYQVRAADHRPLLEGGLDAVVTALVHLLSEEAPA